MSNDPFRTVFESLNALPDLVYWLGNLPGDVRSALVRTWRAVVAESGIEAETIVAAVEGVAQGRLAQVGTTHGDRQRAMHHFVAIAEQLVRDERERKERAARLLAKADERQYFCLRCFDEGVVTVLSYATIAACRSSADRDVPDTHAPANRCGAD